MRRDGLAGVMIGRASHQCPPARARLCQACLFGDELVSGQHAALFTLKRVLLAPNSSRIIRENYNSGRSARFCYILLRQVPFTVHNFRSSMFPMALPVWRNYFVAPLEFQQMQDRT